jgi:tetratricopeptide (TPR) repeat protein
MVDIVDKYCSTPEGAKAGDAIVMTYTIENDTDKIEFWARRLSTSKCGGSQPGRKMTDYAALLNDVRFVKAQKLFDAANFEDAGPIYLQLVNEAPKDKNADKALNNAAVCFEKVHRYNEATKTYERIYREYPDSELAEDALYRAGINHERFFEYQDAVSTYLILAQSPKFKSSPHRVEALGRAAVLLERDQQYARAADLYKQYSAVVTKPDDAADSYFRAATAYEKLKDKPKEVRTLREFIQKYAVLRSAPVSTQLVSAHFKLAEAAENERDREQEYKKVLTEYQARQLPAAGDPAEPAAHAAFLEVERQFADFKRLKFRTFNAKSIQKSFDALTQEAQKLVKEYEKIWSFKRVTWTLAAFERMGDIYYEFAQKLVKAEVPDEIKHLDKKNPGMGVIDQYREALDQKVAPVEKQAQEYWKKTLDKGAELGVANDWVTLARKNLNAYQPDQFPLVKDARIEIEMGDVR